jgi:hypothetical protein
MSATLQVPMPPHVNAMRQRKASEKARARKRREHSSERKATS